ncbi:hypothetical protein [Acinetobacter populi]|uniref:Lipoprotein n=1 Tax=Acinetobacter populi TaxID=1582270 RepID=A0A1Z9Z1G9_9GAMM|nr:hypothetical protein [Acinetobacter populi]OUY08289.1 hypothetical protein CAP51_01315 [Acinetobacter populi]
MKKKYLFLLLLPFILIACKNDWKAKLGWGCFMEGKLCYKSLSYSNSIEQWLVLNSKNKEYIIQIKDNRYNTVLSCEAIDNETTVCSTQQLIIPLDQYNKQCEGRMDFMKYPKDYWKLKYYMINYKKELKPPYIVNEISQNKLISLGLNTWMKKQSINVKHELICGG